MKHKGQPKVVLITGARTGIGRACAQTLVARGHRVYGASRTPPENPEFPYLAMDVNDSTSVETGVQQILDEAGRLDVAVNNAGWGYGGAIEETSIVEAKALFETNFFGVLRVCQAVLPSMRARRQGLIVNVSSVGGLMGMPFQGLYSASKFAIEGLTETLRMEARPWGIDVVALAPGDIQTDFTANRLHTEASQESTVYRDAYAKALVRIERDEQHGALPKTAARTLARIVEARSPRAHYVVGPFYQRIAAVARCFLPRRLVQRLIMLNYDL